MVWASEVTQVDGYFTLLYPTDTLEPTFMKVGGTYSTNVTCL